MTQTLPGKPVAFADLPGWPGADHRAAWRALRASAAAIAAGRPSLRPAQTPGSALQSCCDALLRESRDASFEAARKIFEQAFVPCRLAEPGFLTGYYEPIVDGAYARNEHFTAPVIDRPSWLGALSPETMPDRAALEAYAEGPDAMPVIWLADWVEVFLIHVQGSARVRLPDGTLRRLVYAGRNGLPYTSIGRRLVETGRMSAEAMSLAALKNWLRQAGQGRDEPGRRLMQENRSFIFFRLEQAVAPAEGPIGGQGLPLTPCTSIAVDRGVWSYGLPFFFEAAGPVPGFASSPFSGLFIAQDTGSAIVGPARADLFLGSGDGAGVAAGAIRHPATATVLWPRPA